MNLIQLRYFQTVCACSNMTQAAELLKVSQPSLSSAIQSLEREFGVVLFIRQYRGMELTAEGERLLKMSRSLTEDADKLTRIMRDLGAGRHTLRLGVPPVLGGWLLPRLYADFFQGHPDLQLEILEERRSVVQQKLEHELIDMAFVIHTQPLGGDYKTLCAARLESGGILSRWHPLAGKKRLLLEELAGEKMVLMPELFFQSELLENRFAKAGIQPQILFRTSQIYTMLQLVKKQQAVGFLYREMVQEDPELIFVPFQDPMEIQLSLIWKENHYRSAGMAELLGFFREKARQKNRGGKGGRAGALEGTMV
ncbi:LysR family transcriptional regulator [Acidaminococcus massiliensis]|uniref:LysR family transcriptional regulator n=1 Tax=Acidaminococcus massiliensis TaxID=1852375 RepID=UPI003522B84E